MRLTFLETAELQQQMEGRSVLVVDDEPMIRDLCTKALKGYRILQAGNGEEALAILSRHPVDVVLADVMMPEMNGLDLLSRIKETVPNQVVVIMTGYAEKEIILKALKADADDFISKPINLLQLKTTIDRVLEKKILKEELIHLKKMDQLKGDFLGLVSHKLKTPVTAISLFIQNLARGIGDPADPDFARHLELILKESTYLECLIEDLLLYSDVLLREGTPSREEVDLKELALGVLKGLQEAAKEKGVSLTWRLKTPSSPMKLDRKRIGFALHALVDNAIKFSPSQGRVTVTGKTTENAVRLVIQDQGPGIPREELPKIFEKFYQIDPQHTGQVRGFGLGLFYARQFVQDHGGGLLLESEPGRGTRAVLTLPC